MPYRMTILVWVCVAVATSCHSSRPKLKIPPPTLTIKTSRSYSKTPDPVAITRQVKAAVKQVRAAVVGVDVQGAASGVVVSANGYVLTAAHVVAKTRVGEEVWVTFDKGRRVRARALGYDAAADLALLKIPGPGPWPCVSLATTAPPLGEFCFTLAHPTGVVPGRPAQVRLGRITDVTFAGDKPLIIRADANIQPGDSGGPLFDADGLLIGINSSAVGVMGFNRFGCIDQLHAGLTRMIRGDRFGDPSSGPSNTVVKGGSVTPKTLEIMKREVSRRLRLGHQSTVTFVAGRIDDAGQPKLSPQGIVAALGKDALPLIHGRPVVLGRDDPVILKNLPKLPKTDVRPVALTVTGTQITVGIPVSSRHLLVKASELATLDLTKAPGMAIAGRAPKWDLALVDCGETADFIPLSLAAPEPSVAAGQGLHAVTVAGHVRWGVATGFAYTIKRDPGSIGPVSSQSIISVRRAPYARVIPHDLSLFAADACTPVYTLDGALVGIHAARLNRSTGLIIAVTELKALVERMMPPSKEQRSP